LSVWQYIPVNAPQPYDGYGHSTPRSILYYVPYKSNLISLWDNASYGWRPRAFDTNTAISLAGLPGNTNYDVFASYVNGSVQLSLRAWGDNWTRAAIPGLPQCGNGGILFWEGSIVECGDATKRYLGTIRTSAAGGSTQDNWWRRFVYNYDNQVLTTTLLDHTVPHTFASSFFRQWDNGSYGTSTAAAFDVTKIRIVTGVPCPISIKLSTYMRYGSAVVMVYGASYQRDSAVGWNGVQPFGAQTGYGHLSTNHNVINPTPLGGGSIITQNTSLTYCRNEVGLVELWVAEYGYSADSWFFGNTLSAELMM
jgi:hypothetical protein